MLFSEARLEREERKWEESTSEEPATGYTVRQLGGNGAPFKGSLGTEYLNYINEANVCCVPFFLLCEGEGTMILVMSRSGPFCEE